MTLQEMVDDSASIVFFGGAGVSTQSGIPDFRSVDGLYHQKFAYPPEKMLSHSFFREHTNEFYDFYRQKMLITDAKPNKAHIKLAELENKGKLKAVITQNIDGLHTLAGNKNVYELHGSIYRNYCERCHKFYSIEYIINSRNVPYCQCGGIVKPDVVLYEEGLNDQTVKGAVNALQSADMLIVAGTSLTVYPAAGFIDYFRGKYCVLINKDMTSIDNEVDLVFHDDVGEILDKIK